MAKFSKFIRLLGGTILVCLIVFVGLKGCVVTGWIPPSQPSSYATTITGGQAMSFSFLPDQRALITYGDSDKGTYETVLCKIVSGYYVTHYIGPFWESYPGSKSLLGISWVSDNAEPAHIKYKILNKLDHGLGRSYFPAIGSEHEAIFCFRDGAFKYSDIWLQKVSISPSVIEQFIKELETK